MKIGRSIVLMLMLPMLLAGLVALLINYWSLYSLREKHEQSGTLMNMDVALITEAARLGEDMASLHHRVEDALQGASEKRLDEAQLYLVHTGLVNDLAALKKRVSILSESVLEREISQQDALALSEHTREYGNFVIMATEIAVVNPGMAMRFEGKAQQHFRAFSESSHRISLLLANRTAHRVNEDGHAFDGFFNQVLAIGLAGMFSMLLLAVFSAQKISRQVAEVADALWMLARGKEAPPPLPEIDQMSTSGSAEFKKMAQAVLSFRDALIERNQAEDEIYQLAFYDSLTHLPNRRLLLENLQRGLAVSKRNGLHGAVMFLDLDNFKMLNDTKGHEVGDLLLIKVAARLSSCIRDSDLVARLGGDEFVILLESLDSDANEAAAQAKHVAGKIGSALKQTFHLNGQIHHATSSIGIVLFKGYEDSMDNLLRYADIAMYQAKQSGRNVTCFYDPDIQLAIKARADLEAELHLALEERQFKPYFQVQVDSLRRPVGAEVLLRWIHPERGLISPAQFIPLLEESGMIVPVGLWVMKFACAQLHAWQGDPLTRDLSLAVNVSAKQFRHPDFVAGVQRVLQESGAKHSKLKLELTESAVLDNVEDTISKMRALKISGLSFSMDDFGTGYSSLQYLKKLPLDQIKIDQSFVRDITLDPNNAAIVQAIIAMSGALGLDVIAEGVETSEQRAFLDEHGCHNFQGYLFGRPMPLEQFEESLHAFSEQRSPGNK